MIYVVQAVSEESITLWDGQTHEDKTGNPHTSEVFVGFHTFEVGDKVVLLARLVERPIKDQAQ